MLSILTIHEATSRRYKAPQFEGPIVHGIQCVCGVDMRTVPMKVVRQALY